MKRIVLVTGASSGMGKEAAILLAQSGYQVYAAARRMDKMKDLEPLGIKPIAMDVTQDASMVDGVNRILYETGRIDILINSAGFGSHGAIEDVSMDDARYQLEVNVIGVARLIQLVLPKMREQAYGKIVNLSSIGGRFAGPFGGWYHVSKYALEGLSDSLRLEVKRFGIDVILIEPGSIKTEWGDIAMGNLAKNGTQSVYKKQIDKMHDTVSAMRDKATEPIIIARIIRKSIEAKHPRTRYVAGFLAKPSMIARKILSDKMLDKVILSQFT